MNTKQEYPELQRAIQSLSMVCDGARSEDGMGFNKNDSYFGKSLASQPIWTIRQAAAAYKLARKYQNQLLAMGIPLSSIPEPKEEYIPKPKTIELVDDLFLVSCDLTYNLNWKIKELPGRRWNPDLQKWTVPFWTAEKVEQFADENGFELSENIRSRIASYKKEQAQSLSSSYAEEAEFDVEIKGVPRPYQKAGARYLVDKKRTFLADDMGTGKTLQSIMAIKHEESWPTLIVCPAAVKINWMREIKMWIDEDSHVLFGRPSKEIIDLLQKYYNNTPSSDNLLDMLNENPLTGYGTKDYQEYLGLGDYKKLCEPRKFYIINYDILQAWLPFLEFLKFRTLVSDESSNLKNGKAKRTKAVMQLARNIEYRFLLSGTPMLNRPAELISQLQILDRLQDLGGWKFFVNHYCDAGYNKYGLDTSGASNLEELGQTLRQTCMIRRTKKDVLKELPDKQRSYVYLPIDNRREYSKAEADIVSWVGQQARKEQQFLDSISYLDQETQARLIKEHQISAEVKAERAEHLVKIENLKQLAARGKMAAVLEWIEQFLETGEKLVVFGWHKSIVEEIANYFGAPYITGDTKLETRQRYIDAFQGSQDTVDGLTTQLLVMNIKSGGMGITLTAASNVMFIEQGWSPSEMHQAEDRAHRLGTKNAVTCWYMLGEKTIDIDINELLQNKSNVITNIVGGEKIEAQEQDILSNLMDRLRARTKI